MELQFSKGKIIGHIVAYVLLFLAGDLLNSLVFDLLFSIVELPIRGLYSVLRTLGCFVFTYLLFWLYTIMLHTPHFGPEQLRPPPPHASPRLWNSWTGIAIIRSASAVWGRRVIKSPGSAPAI